VAEPPTAAAARCARCGAAFHCGAQDARPCWFCTLRVEPAVLAEMASRWRGCLCPACLGQLAGVQEPPAGGGVDPAG
jgi:hypothetical protein